MLRKLALLPLVALVIGACGGAAQPSPSATTAATAAPSKAAATATPKPAPTKLVVGFSEIYQGSLPMWYAAEKGIFAKNGLDVTLQYTSSSTGVAALISGNTQIFQGGGSETLSADAQGADLVVVGNIVPIYPYVFMSPADIKTVADLKGKKVGASSVGSTSDIATRVGLAKEGIDPDKDVTMVYVGSSSNRTAALLNNSIQGGLDQPPGSLQLEAKGLHVLFNEVDEKLPVVNNGIVVQRSFMTAHKDAVQAYVDSIVEAIAALRKDKEGGVAVLTKEMKIADAKIAASTYDFSMKIFPNIPLISADAFKDSVTVLSKKNPKIAQFDVNKIIDNTFMKSASDRGLDKK
ncbi:MAG: ABC transporter substrate-binding protein [Chloroflexota bacterium]|nr:ABC transporter substrate-binding protein [Chloroflexota bacterium]MDE3193857.1 ABC transporter substrate-binding protein [Chloroflexota bacterium]